MADEAKPGTPTPGQEQKADPIAELKQSNAALLEALGNLKAEMNRKIDGLKPQPPKHEPVLQKKSLKDLWYENEEEAARTIKEQAVTEAVNVIDERLGKQAKQQQVVSKLYTDYPELQHVDNPLTKKANEIYQSLSDEEKADPRSMRLAVAEAALDLGIKPASKRRSDGDDESFSLGSGKQGSGEEPPRRSRKKDELAPETLEAARLMGLDTEDPKVMERLKQHAKRDDWTRYR